MQSEISFYTLTYFFDSLVGGCTLGSTYALIALGYTMVFGIIQLLNFAHGEFYAAGGFMGVIILSWLTAQGYAQTYPLLCLGGTFILAMSYSAMLAMAVEKVAYSPLRNASRLALLLSALGMSIFLQNGFMLTQGGDRRTIPVPFENTSLYFGELRINLLQLMIMGVTIGLLVGLNFSRIGRAWEAMREDETTAELMGVNTYMFKLLAYAMGAMFGGLAGAFFAAWQGSIFPTSFSFIESAMVLSMVVLGGMGSLPGVILGALVLIALPEAFRDIQEYRMLAFGAAMTTMMIFRPEGLLPAKRFAGRSEEK